jgi:acyl carrier protein
MVALVAERLRELDPPGGAGRVATASEATVLFGEGGLLDSLGLVSLLADVEDAVAAETGVEVTLGDERAVSASSSPFRTVASLADHAMRALAQDAPA